LTGIGPDGVEGADDGDAESLCRLARPAIPNLRRSAAE
jgi:hypothetical protein